MNLKTPMTNLKPVKFIITITIAIQVLMVPVYASNFEEIVFDKSQLDEEPAPILLQGGVFETGAQQEENSNLKIRQNLYNINISDRFTNEKTRYNYTIEANNFKDSSYNGEITQLDNLNFNMENDSHRLQYGSIKNTNATLLHSGVSFSGVDYIYKNERAPEIEILYGKTVFEEDKFSTFGAKVSQKLSKRVKTGLSYTTAGNLNNSSLLYNNAYGASVELNLPYRSKILAESVYLSPNNTSGLQSGYFGLAHKVNAVKSINSSDLSLGYQKLIHNTENTTITDELGSDQFNMNWKYNYNNKIRTNLGLDMYRNKYFNSLQNNTVYEPHAGITFSDFITNETNFSVEVNQNTYTEEKKLKFQLDFKL